MVTTKTLRHYDTIGLLVPAYTSPETGYRYYEAHQLQDMLKIQKLKEYGFPLDEIMQLMHSDTNALCARFKAKYAEQRTAIKNQKKLLSKMKKDLEFLQKGQDIMSGLKTEVKLVQTEPIEIVSERGMIAIKDFDTLYNKAMKKLQENGLAGVGAPVALYHCPDFDPENSDIEVGFPVKKKDGITRTIAGSECAMGVHTGTYATLNKTYAAIAEWISRNGYRIAAPPYERYLNSPGEVTEENLMTEVYFPIAKQA